MILDSFLACCLIDEEDTDDKIDELEEKVEEIPGTLERKNIRRTSVLKGRNKTSGRKKFLKANQAHILLLLLTSMN